MSELLLDIAVTNRSGRNTKHWKNQKVTWETLKKRLSETLRTLESVKEYHAMSKSEQGEKKDHGGFVGGYLDGGRRSVGSVRHRSVICLDLDAATPDAWETIKQTFTFECLVYSTHSHIPEKPRLRLIIPLSEIVTPDNYQAISRNIAHQIGMDMFDPTTFQPSRLMYWPSTAKDGEFYYQAQNGNILTPDTILSLYVDPNDISAWPQHPSEKESHRKQAAKQGDPRDKDGIIGAFCRAFDIHAAIDEFGLDYEPTVSDDRYTYLKGSSFAGAVVYNDDFIFSHHGTDPISGQLCNAFDMVRIHLYGEMDFDSTAKVPPSFKKMIAFATTLPQVRQEAVLADFSAIGPQIDPDNPDAEPEEINVEWAKNLTVERTGEVQTTIPNFELIIDNDPRLKGRFYYDEFEDRTFGLLPLPWEAGDRLRDLKDIDDSNLESFISKEYKIHHSTNIKKAFDNVCYRYKKHPVRDYLDKLQWDKKSRAETLLIDYLGADDTPYVRTVTRKMLAACVTRIYNPGAKFDNSIILIGPEGIFKSTLISRIGQKWFSDSFVGVKGVDSMQQLQGTWLMEMSELEGLKKADITSVKSFLSKTMDKYRSSYGRRNNIHPRQTVFWGTTNEESPLKGDTGNRRFWPVTVQGVTKQQFNKLTQAVVDQIWAEAKHFYQQNEDLDLPDNIRIEAKEMQKKHTESDSRKGMISNYLELLLPENWDEMGRQERHRYIHGDDPDFRAKGVNRRDRVCAAEIWIELLGGNLKELNNFNTKPVHEAMDSMQGWERTENPQTFSIYGRQRAYVRTGGTVSVKTKSQNELTEVLNEIL